MIAKTLFGASLLLAAAAGFAGTSTGQFAIQITLNNSCTSATDSGAGGASVQVSCTANVFVNIAQGRFMPGFRPGRDSLLPDYCRNEQMGLASQAARITCRLDDAQRPLAYGDDETDEGWKVESRLYAVDGDATATQAQTQARLRLQGNRGTLTALRVAHADGRLGPVEMLVSF